MLVDFACIASTTCDSLATSVRSLSPFDSGLGCGRHAALYVSRLAHKETVCRHNRQGHELYTV